MRARSRNLREVPTGRRASPLFMCVCVPVVCMLATGLIACASRKVSPVIPPVEGTASWYGDDFHGRTTSSGHRYNMYRLTAASRDIPLGSEVKVTRLDTGESVTVTINDRGPFVEGRIIDLSYEAAWRLDMLETGLAAVRIEVLSIPGGAPTVQPPTTATARLAPSPPPGSSPASEWWVSLGTFTLRRNAVWLRDRVAPDIPKVGVRDLGEADSELWQVSIGPHPTREAAAKTGARLRELGLKSSLLEEPRP